MKYFFFLALIASNAFATEVTLNVSQTANRNGKLYVAVFNDPGTFPDKTPFKTAIVPTNGAATVNVKLDLPEGDYAVSLFLDENGNGKLDSNFLGIPKERFGFSNNPRIIAGPPSYQDCDVRVGNSAAKFDIRLIKLF